MQFMLRAVSSTTSVRVTDGETRVVDGPCAEVKEQLGGFHVIDVRDLDVRSRGRLAVPVRAAAWSRCAPSGRDDP
jgi:hypothetical protein